MIQAAEAIQISTEAISPVEEPEDVGVHTRDCISLKVFQISREIFSAIGKGCLGTGIVLGMNESCITPLESAMRISGMTLSIIGVSCMVISSVCGTIAHIKCRNTQ